MRHRFGSAACALLLAGCASIDVQRVTDANRDTLPGIRYWRPAPYLLVSASGTDGACTAKITWLPNPAEEYAIQAKPGLGTVSVKPTLTDGWQLTAFDATADTKVGSEIIQLFAAAAGVEIKLNGTGTSALQPGIYRLVVVKDAWVVDTVRPTLTIGDPCRTVVGGSGDGKNVNGESRRRK